MSQHFGEPTMFLEFLVPTRENISISKYNPNASSSLLNMLPGWLLDFQVTGIGSWNQAQTMQPRNNDIRKAYNLIKFEMGSPQLDE